MKRLAFTLPLVGMLLILSTATALAGVEPVPFQVQRAKLSLVAQSLSGAPEMIDAVLGIDPEPFCPVPANVMADEIRDLAKQIQRHEERVEAVLENHPPDPGLPPDECTALPELGERLGDIRALTTGIISTVDLYLGTPPDDQKVINSLDKLRRNAQSLVDMIDAFMGTPPTDRPE